MARNRRRSRKKRTQQSRCQVIPIDTLPDELLLAIFGFFVDEDAVTKNKNEVEAWQSLVHVCQRWRSVVFGSPRRLNLRLFCEAEIPVRDTMDIWPPLPLVIRDEWIEGHHVDNIITLLERSNRLCQIYLSGTKTPLERVMPAMQKLFPELTDLVLWSHFMNATVPDSFLGGSAPCLRRLELHCIPFPGLPRLLLSATHLVNIRLHNIPDSGYFSPEALVTTLSTLTSLRLLIVKFRHSPNQTSQLPPPTRSLLPVLNTLKFQGFSEYLDDLVARIDAPRLDNLEIIFFNQSVFDTPQFTQFISRVPMLEALENAYFVFQLESAAVKLSSQTSGYGEFRVKFPWRGLELQVSSLKWFSTSCLPLSTSEDLHICWDERYQEEQEENVENILWLELLHLFPAVKNLYLSESIVPYIGPALKELVGGSTTEVLPIVQNIFLQGIRPRGPILEGIEEFIAARPLSGQPITVSTIPSSELYLYWASEFDD